MAEAEQLRVILVGPTGLDARLRFRPGVELVHVANAMDAVGELGDPLDDNSPSRSVVILAQSRRPPQGAADFVRALREVQPSVRVILASANGQDASAFDGTIDPNADENGIRRALGEPILPIAGSQSTPSPTGPSPEPQSKSSTGSAIEAPAQVLRSSPLPETIEPLARTDEPDNLGLEGDGALVSAMLHGQDILPPAIEALSERLGRGVSFSADAGQDAADATEVRWHDRVFGWLRAPNIDDETLAREALWLAGWLRLNEQQKQLREAALTDPLTGAWNRRYFDRFLPVAIERARKARGSLTLLVFDIDDFKQFNTQFGHPAGDEILIETVKLLRSTIRPTDRVCRIGGDEFCVIFHEPAGPREAGSKPPDNVYQISKRFQLAICDQRFPKLGLDAPGTLSISGGMATYPWDGRDARELLEHADQLSLQSKQQGKNAILLGPGAARVCGTDEDAN